eukprot:c32331_g1_i1.p1 GENE.c32331_g1_i1~~c32331_g1_i1.p1  ORF type:complete len:537 (-),score=70.36 c32331_g1_i1:57-1631(-)
MSAFAINCTCLPGTFASGVSGLTTPPVCTPCPNGARCAGALSVPTAMAGFTPDSTGNNRFVACPVREACVEGGHCRRGYTGRLCADCIRGWYRTGGVCKPCNESYSILTIAALCILLFALACFVLAIAVYGKASIGSQLPAIAIAINAIQLLSLVAQIDVQWPEAIQSCLDALSLLNWNMELAAPECNTLQISPFLSRLLLTLLLPLFAAVAMAIAMASAMLASQIGLLPGGLRFAVLWGAGRRACLQMMGVLYLPLAAFVVGFFDCRFIGSQQVLKSDPSVRCYGREWMQLLPIIVAGIVVYVLGMPAAVAISLRGARISAASMNELHLRWGFLTAKYRDAEYAYDVAIMIRTMMTIIVLAVFNSANAEAIVVGLVIQLATWHLLSKHPFRSERHNLVSVGLMSATSLVLLAAVTSERMLSVVLVSAALIIFAALIITAIAVDVVVMLRDRKQASEAFEKSAGRTGTHASTADSGDSARLSLSLQTDLVDASFMDTRQSRAILLDEFKVEQVPTPVPLASHER